MMTRRWAAAGLALGLALLLSRSLPAGAEDQPASALRGDGQRQVVAELAEGIALLKDQIRAQEELLTRAQTAREQQLIRHHIRALQKERRSFESLMLRLGGPEPGAD